MRAVSSAKLASSSESSAGAEAADRTVGRESERMELRKVCARRLSPDGRYVSTARLVRGWPRVPGRATVYGSRIRGVSVGARMERLTGRESNGRSAVDL